MKKHFSFIAVLMAGILLLSACGKKTAPASEKESSQTEVESSESVESESSSSEALPSESSSVESSSAAEKSSSEAESSSQKAEVEDELKLLQDLAKKIASSQLGSAGSSLSMAATANDLLPHGKLIQANQADFKQMLVDQAKAAGSSEELKEILEAMSDHVQGLVKKDELEWGAAADAGVEKVNDSDLSAEDWQKLFKELAK